MSMNIGPSTSDVDPVSVVEFSGLQISGRKCRSALQRAQAYAEVDDDEVDAPAKERQRTSAIKKVPTAKTTTKTVRALRPLSTSRVLKHRRQTPALVLRLPTSALCQLVRVGNELSNEGSDEEDDEEVGLSEPQLEKMRQKCAGVKCHPFATSVGSTATSANPRTVDRHKRWIKVNWKTLIQAKLPAMTILDVLVTKEIYSPSDENYQTIRAQLTDHSRVRCLLETLLSKSGKAVDVFKEALSENCPHILAMCIDLPSALKEFDCAVRSHYKENLKVRQLPWSQIPRPVNPSNFFLNLSMVEIHVGEQIGSDLMQSSTIEIQRQEYLDLLLADQKQVCFDSLFAQFQDKQKCGQDTATEASQSCTDAGLVKTANVAVANVSNAYSVVRGEDHQSNMLQSAKHVGIYGGAGRGKTSCLMKAASMFAENNLWQGAHAFLLVKLRDPKVQKADTLKQLLRELKLGTGEKCEEFADVLDASEGEGIIFGLDGLDELDPQKKGFIWSLLDGSALPKACVIATSRPSSIAKMYFDKYKVNFELLGFKEEQVYQFIEKQLGDKPELLSNLHRFLLDNPMLFSLMLVPLLAMMVCQLFRQTTKKPPTTRTSLYSTLHALVVRRTVATHEGRLSLPKDELTAALAVSDVQKLEGRAQEFVLELAQLAHLTHSRNKVVFDHSFVKEAHCSNEALQLGLLSGYCAEEGLDIVPQYYFQHRTIQEFLVAYHLAAHTTTEQAVRDYVNNLVSSRHNRILLQFFAGLLAKGLQPYFFACLDQWLHTGYSDQSEECRNRLRVCLLCAKEACGENVGDFPSTLQLPENVRLDHVTAADLTQLALAIEKSQYIELLSLRFEVETDKGKVRLVQTQTRRGMTRLLTAINVNKSLRALMLYVDGPKCSLLEEEGWRLLVKTVEKNSLVWLGVVGCTLNNATFPFLSSVLRNNTELKWLWLVGNSLNDESVCTLANDLKDNSTLRTLDIRGNSYADDCREHLQRQLKHIRDVLV